MAPISPRCPFLPSALFLAGPQCSFRGLWSSHCWSFQVGLCALCNRSRVSFLLLCSSCFCFFLECPPPCYPASIDLKPSHVASVPKLSLSHSQPCPPSSSALFSLILSTVLPHPQPFSPLSSALSSCHQQVLSILLVLHPGSLSNPPSSLQINHHLQRVASVTSFLGLCNRHLMVGLHLRGYFDVSTRLP